MKTYSDPPMQPNLDLTEEYKQLARRLTVAWADLSLARKMLLLSSYVEIDVLRRLVKEEEHRRS